MGRPHVTARLVRCAAAFADDRGFTVLEALVAAAIVSVAAFAGLTACKAVAAATSSIAASSSAAALDTQASQLRADAATAFAVFVPAADLYGRPNLGQELDFYARANDASPVYWRYVYDPAARTLQRVDYAPGGATGVRDVKTGVIDPSAAYPPLKGVTRFGAAAVAADALGDPARNAYAGIAGIFARAPQALPVNYDDPASGGSGGVGGNGVVQVVLGEATAVRTVHLAAGAMPTGFTVTGLPLWHAVVYRVDQSHRFLFGFAGKSHVFINARVDVSYDGWTTRKSWCNFNLLGNPDGLDPHDPHADFKPDEPVEQADTIFAACQRLKPLPPRWDSPGNPAEPGTVVAPEPAAPAPRCWTQPGPAGRCWPDTAPPDWAPPSPFPVESPPPAWCAARPASPICQGGGAVSSRR